MDLKEFDANMKQAINSLNKLYSELENDYENNYCNDCDETCCCNCTKSEELTPEMEKILKIIERLKKLWCDTHGGHDLVQSESGHRDYTCKRCDKQIDRVIKRFYPTMSFKTGGWIED